MKKKMIECPECEGTGQRAFAVNCPEFTPCVDCGGTGKCEAGDIANEKTEDQGENF